LTQWTIPHTEITLVRISKGLRQGQWVFSSETDDRVEFYERVKHVAYKPGDRGFGHELFVSEPGPLIPRSSFVRCRVGCRRVTRANRLAMALVLTLIVTAALMVLVYPDPRRWRRTADSVTTRARCSRSSR
jgi:hypothetical protein